MCRRSLIFRQVLVPGSRCIHGIGIRLPGALTDLNHTTRNITMRISRRLFFTVIGAAALAFMHFPHSPTTRNRNRYV